MAERYELAGDWGLRPLSEGDPQRPAWAIQFKGMDCIRVSDFVAPAADGRSTLDEEMRAFAEAIGGKRIEN